MTKEQEAIENIKIFIRSIRSDLVEENKEIEELNDTNYNCEEMSIEEINYYNNLTRTKLNEVIQAVNKLNKEREEK